MAMQQVQAVLLRQMRKEGQRAGTGRGAQGTEVLLIPALLNVGKIPQHSASPQHPAPSSSLAPAEL